MTTAASPIYRPRPLSADFHPRFEGKTSLDAQLASAGSRLTSEEVVDRFRIALQEGRAPAEIMPTLFEGEPRFSDPAQARRIYENLFGLWALLKAGGPVALDAPARLPEPPPPVRPPPFEMEPDDAYVEAAWRYLDAAEPKVLQRLEHTFENRQDALWMHLEEANLSDAAHGQARALLFETWALLDLGWSAGLRSVRPEALRDPEAEVPAALARYIDEALFEAQHDETEPLPVADVERVRQVVTAAAAALWSARKPRVKS